VWPKHNVSRAAHAVLGLMEEIFPTPDRPPGRILD
jgi:hypothetical protein